jgi:trk system potassium uptake protein TrkA
MREQYIIIVGCGRLGALLANQLSRAGHSLVVIDRRQEAFAKLSSEFSGFQLHNDAAELDVLRLAKIDRADCLLATTDNDNLNLMVAQIARFVFNVSTVIARVYDPAYETIYHELGIEVVSPTQLSGDAFAQMLARPKERD